MAVTIYYIYKMKQKELELFFFSSVNDNNSPWGWRDGSQLEAHAVLAKNWNLVPSTHTKQLTAS